MAVLFLLVSASFFLAGVVRGRISSSIVKSISRDEIMDAISQTGSKDITKLVASNTSMLKAEKFYIISALVSLVGFVILASQ